MQYLHTLCRKLFIFQHLDLKFCGVKLEKLGTVTTGNIQISGADFGQTEQYKNTFLTSLENKLA
jgi:hypothetical protein